MSGDVVFFLKAAPTHEIAGLRWPPGTKLVAVDPPAECMCGGTDPRCSTAYDCLWRQTGSVKAFVDRFAPGATGRVAFAGFSAAHGLLNPMMHAPEDRARVSALLLFDASFGGGKTGYRYAVQDAAAGRMLLVATTGVTGGDASFKPVWEQAQADVGRTAIAIDPPSNLPVRPQAAFRLGDAFYLPYGADLPHQSTGKIMPAVLSDYLIPWWRGTLRSPGTGGSGSLGKVLIGFTIALGAGLAARAITRRR